MEEHSFGYWLRRRRKALDLTQDGLADRVGCSVAMIRKIESEERRPSEQIAQRLADIFSIPQNERSNFLKFARGDWQSAPTEIKENIPWQSSTKSVPSNLPATVTSLIGREKEIKDVRAYLAQDDIRLVTLLGPPGIGKTRLSIETARAILPDFPDGVFFVALAPLDDPALIASAVVQALGFMEAGNLAADEQLTMGIAEKQMLIVLDNCEHLIEGVASLASFLLSACSRLKILATSRESVRILGEWLYPVPAFDLPVESSSVDLETASTFPALMLFAERARAVRPDFVLDSENIKMVSAICAQLDGLPLAIELIAARMRFMSPQVLLERLSGQFVLTADGMRAASTRQKTLNNAIGWSYSLLSDEEQKLFACLSVFSGGFTLSAAEAIFAHTVTGKSVTELVALLLDKSLIRRSASESNEDRYQMLVTIQEYALNRLKQSGDEIETRNRQLAYFSGLAEQARLHLRSSDQLEWLDRLDTEYDNIRAALNWAQASGAIAEGLRLITALEWFWAWRVHLQEPILALENLLAGPLPADQNLVLTGAHRVAGHLQSTAGNKISADAHFKERERLCLLLGPEGKVEKARLLNFILHESLSKEPNQIHRNFDEVLKLLQETGDQWEMALLLRGVGLELARGGDSIGARQALEQSRMLFRECGDSIGAYSSDGALMLFALEEGKYAEARAQLEEILHFYRQARLDYFIDAPLWMLGVIAVREKDYARAKERYTECLLFDGQIGLTKQLAECLIGFAGIASAESRFERAAQLLVVGEAEVEARGTGALENIDRIEVHRLTALLRQELGDSRFEALASQGRAMTREQAIAYALEDGE
jgi:predicted ATPase/DNA-binding XRE family transcriptional regulator